MPALDGLRGAAVFAILLFHAGHLRGGWLGVDLFFVVSGFLITSLLLVEHETTGRVALSAFWSRRARRLLPALFATLFGVTLYAGVLAEPNELARIRADAVATLFYVANWHSIIAGNEYWELFRAPSPLEHTWSLAIEEQFYLLWPPLLLLLLGRFRATRSALAVAALLLALSSALWMAWLFDPNAGTARVYYGADTRAFALLLGIVVAAVSHDRVARSPDEKHLGLDVLGWLGILMLLVGWLGLDGRDPAVYRGLLFALACAAAATVAASVWSPAGSLARAAGVAPLRGLGVISYGVYLWHWPIYLALSPERVALDGALLTCLRIAVTLAVSWVSYVVIERPIRHRRLTPRGVLAGSLAGGMATLACVAWSTRAPVTTNTPPASIALDDDAPVVMLLGDSLAENLGQSFRESAAKRGLRGVVRARLACSALRATRIRFPGGRTLDISPCLETRSSWIQEVAATRPPWVLILEGWAGGGAKELDGDWSQPCDSAFDQAHEADLEDLVTRLQATGSKVALLAAMPPSMADLSDHYVAQWGPDNLGELERRFEIHMQCQNRVRRDVAARTGATLLDLSGSLCAASPCPRSLDDMLLRADGVHFSGPAADWLSDWLLDRIELPRGSEGAVP